MVKKYKVIAGDSHRKAVNEENDCVVTSLALVCDRPYKWAYDLFESIGRQAGRRFRFLNCLSSLDDYGILYQKFKPDRKPDGGKYTQVTIANILPKQGRFVCICRSHVFCVIDGVVEDWADDQRIQVNHIYQFLLPAKVGG